MNKNQQLILNELAESDGRSLKAHIHSISATRGIPLSTLKLNARILVELQLVEPTNHRASLSPSGSEAVLMPRELDARTHGLQEVS